MSIDVSVWFPFVFMVLSSFFAWTACRSAKSQLRAYRQIAIRSSVNDAGEEVVQEIVNRIEPQCSAIEKRLGRLELYFYVCLTVTLLFFVRAVVC